MITNGKYKFLIIDDHPFTRDGIKDFVKAHEQFEFIGEFGDTRSVLNSAVSGIPDVIILDLNLPGVDGEKSCPSLKKRFPACKIVACTQYKGREKQLMRIGFDGYIVKSERDKLIEALLTVLNGNKYFPNVEKFLSPGVAEENEIDPFVRIKELTVRESEVAKYMIEDFSSREIAERIFISEATVETHRKHIKEKMKAKNKHELYTMLRTYISP